MGIKLNSGLVFEDGKSFTDLLKKLENDEIITAQTSDNLLAEIGAKGRRKVTDFEERTFAFGESQVKNGRQAKVYSKYDSELGGWKSISRNMRLMGFKYEKSAYSRRRGIKFSTVSKGKMYSNVANLWDKQTKPYKSASPLVGREGSSFRWKKGARRPARPTWGVAEIREVVAPAVKEATATLSARLKKEHGVV